MNKSEATALIKELNKASEAYYNTGHLIMSDAEFDSKIEDLRRWESATGIILEKSPTQNVGASILKDIKEVTHKTPMLSLDKVHSVDEILKFAKDNPLTASVKLDGITIRLTYDKNGNLILAESRGNGVVGNDLTEHVKNFQNVPSHIERYGSQYIIDGEALIKLDDFDEVNRNGEFKNSRNLTAGTLASLDTSVVKNRKIRWYAWENVTGSAYNSFSMALLEAKNLGFDVVPNKLISREHPGENINVSESTIDYFIEMAKQENLPQDGVVFKFDNIKYGRSLGNTTHHFRNGIAYKVYNDSVETTLKSIEWTMGKTGTLCPVAIFDPVEIEGTTVEKASLHNITMMYSLIGRPWKGQKIGVYKANLIIPQVRWGEKIGDRTCEDILKLSFINIPQCCPYCGSKTSIKRENDSETLYCTNENCKGRLLGKLSHAASRNALDIDGLSEATIKKFIELGWLDSIESFFRLSDHKSEISHLSGFGKKSTEKLLAAIESCRHTTLDRFLYALSIPMVGKTVSKQISDLCNGNFEKLCTLITLHGASYFNCLDGVGDSITSSLNSFWNTNQNKVINVSKNFVFEENRPTETTSELSGKTFCVTGSLKHFSNRDELKQRIKDMGGKVSDSVTGKTSFLINNDSKSTSGKNKKAHELNIPIITEEQFLEMIGGN